jgi:hypothetical protein
VYTAAVRRIAIALLLAAACNEKRRQTGGFPEAAATALPAGGASSVQPQRSNVGPDPGPDAGPGAGANAGPDAYAQGDAGRAHCKLAYGPTEQPFRGAVAIETTPTEVRLVANDQGKPRVQALPIGARPLPPGSRPAPSAMRSPPCEIAGRFAYCQAPGGAVLRTAVGTGESKTIAKSRAGTRIAAAPIGSDHAVVAFIDLRRTSEGDMLQAFAVVDEGEPIRISDDGAGATTLRFLPRRDAPIVVYLDARSAMVPVHARSIAFENGKPRLGTDTIVFVGGAPERFVDLAVANVGGSARGFAFVPLPRDTTDFGVAALALEDPPKEDVAAVWSAYPNGLDPAPIAAASAREGGAWVARVRPSARAPRAPRLLELGRVNAGGSFAPAAEVATGSITDVAVAEDPSGAVWIAWVDPTSTWLTRFVCTGGT